MNISEKKLFVFTILLFTGLTLSAGFSPEAAGKSEDRPVPALPAPITDDDPNNESSGPLAIHPSNTVGIQGDLAQTMSWTAQTLVSRMSFHTDIRLRSHNGGSIERNQTMACDESGNFYVAWEDDYLGLEYIQIYWSQDDGLTWKPYWALVDSNAALTEPSLTVAEGNPNRIMVVYIKTEGVKAPRPEIAVKDLASGGFTSYGIPIWTTWEAYRKPVIWTDSTQYHGWYTYITCEGVFDSVTKNVNIVVYRSTDGGETFDKNITVFGESDTDEWIDPDGCFGTTKKRNFVVVHNQTNQFCYWGKSVDDGVSWDTMWFANMTSVGIPSRPVDPEIEASRYNDFVHIAATRRNDYTDTIGFSWSPNAGDGFYSLHNLFPQHTEPRFAAALHANQLGGSYHLAYTSNNKVYYSVRPQDLSADWSTPVRVDDAGYASNANTKKGIASIWYSDMPGIAWADFRDGTTSDYDTYFDTPTERSFEADKTTLSAATGGTVKFYLDAGYHNADRKYVILMSATGTWPGTTLPGGKVLPIQWDAMTDLGLDLIYSPLMTHFLDDLDASGNAMAYLTLPPIPGFSGFTLCFAYCLYNPYDFVSNPWMIDILP